MTAWRTAYTAAVAGGYWCPSFVLSLEILARVASRYVALAREVARLDPAQVSTDLRAAVEEHRQLARRCMADWFLIPRGRVALGETRPDGLDADIARLCGVPLVH